MIRRLSTSVAMAAILGAFISHSANAQTASGWQVSTNGSEELFGQIRAALNGAGAHATVDGRMFSIKRNVQSSDSLAIKKQLVIGWEHRLAALLKDYDSEFREISEDEMRQHGVDLGSSLREFLINAQLFGKKRQVAAHASDYMAIFINEDPAFCPLGRGAMGALVSGYYPDDNVASDYGNVMIMIFGLGQCGEFNQAVANDLSTSLETITSTLDDDIAGN